MSDWSSGVGSSDLVSVVVENETGRDGRLQGRSELRKLLLPAVRIECGELRVVERLRGSEQPQKARTILTQTGKLCGRHIDPWGTHAAPGIAVRIQDKGATIRHLKPLSDRRRFACANPAVQRAERRLHDIMMLGRCVHGFGRSE